MTHVCLLPCPSRHCDAETRLRCVSDGLELPRAGDELGVGFKLGVLSTSDVVGVGLASDKLWRFKVEAGRELLISETTLSNVVGKPPHFVVLN